MTNVKMRNNKRKWEMRRLKHLLAKDRLLTVMIGAFVMCHLSFSQAVAQVKVEGSISSMEMLIGEQVAVTVTATAPDTATVRFPDETMLPTVIEFLGKIDNPTEKLAGGMQRQSRSYVFTSYAAVFDDTLLSIPPFTVTVSGQEYQTNELPLKVLTVDVDTTDWKQFFGPRDVQDNPFEWEDWAPTFWLSLVLLLLLAVIYYLYLRLRDNKPVIARIRIIKRILPHQKAMKAIEEIKAEHMVTAEDPKEYYTRLTDTLRQYIEERYGFSAMEMTSSEIIDRLTHADDPTMLTELQQLFETADLVKFAKWSTLINENDANLVSAIEFINQTKQENQPTEEVVKPELSVEELRSKKSRTALKATLIILGVASLLLFGYIAYNTYLLL